MGFGELEKRLDGAVQPSTQYGLAYRAFSPMFYPRIKEISQSPKGTMVVMEQHVHIVGQDRPALVYELIFIYM